MNFSDEPNQEKISKMAATALRCCSGCNRRLAERCTFCHPCAKCKGPAFSGALCWGCEFEREVQPQHYPVPENRAHAYFEKRAYPLLQIRAGLAGFSTEEFKNLGDMLAATLAFCVQGLFINSALEKASCARA